MKLKNLKWKKVNDFSDGTSSVLEMTRPSKIYSHSYTEWLFYIGQYADDGKYTVGLRGQLFPIKERWFKTENSCKKYVTKELKLFLSELGGFYEN